MARRQPTPAGRGSLIEDPTTYRGLTVALTAMSVLALAICLLASDPPGDEGTMAHLYQLIIGVQAPIICMFVGVVVRRGLRRNLPALGAQLALFAAALAAVPVLGL